jgi:hypothetical protein
MTELELEKYLANFKSGQWFGFKDSNDKCYSNIVVYDDTVLPSAEDIIRDIEEEKYLKEVNEYKEKRQAEYPSYAEYVDGVVKGDQDQIDAYIAACQAVKDKYPKLEMDATELASRQAQALFDYQLEEYTKAQARLAQYQVALGREEETEEVVVGQEWNEETEEMVDVTETRVTVSAIEPVEATVERTVYSDDPEEEPTVETIENPLITKDNEERAEAQAVVDATPQEVIDAYNSL